MTHPRVTIGIPVYAARPWVDRIVDNIGRNAAPDVEFVLSDQHGIDDAVEVIERSVDRAANVRVLTSRTGAGWIDNYNQLLSAARGDYMRILAQDDVLPERSLRVAATVLDADPQTVLVVGPTDLIDRGGRVLWRDKRLRASGPGRIGLSPVWDAIRLFAGSRYENANLGMFRRAVATSAGLSIPFTAGESGLSLRALMFAIALRGRVRYEPGYESSRCLHADSYTARHWERSMDAELRRARSYVEVGKSAWLAADAGGLQPIVASTALGAAVAHMVARRALLRMGSQYRAVASSRGRDGSL